VKKKFFASSKDKKDWINFTKKMNNISSKEADNINKNPIIYKTRKIDLHGYSLIEANKVISKFIIDSFNKKLKKLLVVTGKGSRSKSYDNPYLSEKLSKLKYSIPEYIKNDKNLNKIVRKIAQADRDEGGDGAIYIFLKNNKN
jgi:DNA-nicking Smr family endonuclease